VTLTFVKSAAFRAKRAHSPSRARWSSIERAVRSATKQEERRGKVGGRSGRRARSREQQQSASARNNEEEQREQDLLFFSPPGDFSILPLRARRRPTRVTLTLMRPRVNGNTEEDTASGRIPRGVPAACLSDSAS